MPKKILVADDERSLLDLIRSTLEENGYEVETAVDGTLTTQFAHTYKPDLILLDLSMPAGGGHAAYSHLKYSQDTASIPVVFITAYATPRVLQEVEARRAQGYLAKPFKMDELLKVVKDILGE